MVVSQEPILGLSVLIWKQVSCWIEIWPKKMNFKIFISRKFVQIGLLSAVKLDRLDVQRQFVCKKMGLL